MNQEEKKEQTEQEKPEESRQEAPAEAEKTPEDLLKEKEEQIQELYKQILRLNADFDNYRKRVEREKQAKFMLGKETILAKVLGLTDVFEKALEMNSKNGHKDVIHGIKLLHKEFTDFLKKEGVKEIDALNKKLEPTYHEVVGFEYNDNHQDSTVIKEVQKGYIYDDYVLRPSKVIVSKVNEKKESPDTEKEKPESV